jgi:hypothetical protein
MSGRATRGVDRVAERRRAVALARHYRDFEGMSIRQIAARLGRSPATVKAYFYDPTGEKAKAVKARYTGVCRGCGADTQPRNGKGDAYAYCKTCHPGAIERRWTRELAVAAMLEWRERYGQLPSSYDWSRTHARRSGGEALRRLESGVWPPASVVGGMFGNWASARRAAGEPTVECVDLVAENDRDFQGGLLGISERELTDPRGQARSMRSGSTTVELLLKACGEAHGPPARGRMRTSPGSRQPRRNATQ